MNFYRGNSSTPLSHISSGRFISKRPFLHTKRRLDSYVLLVGLEGELYIQEEDTKYILKPGTILLLSPHLTHFGYEKSSDLSYFWCHFSCNDSPLECIDENEAAATIYLIKNNFRSPPVFNHLLLPKFYEPPSDSRIVVLFNQLLHNTNCDYYLDCSADYLLTLIAIEITQQLIESYEHKNITESSRLIEVLEWIRINIDQPLTVRGVSEHFHYNPDYLSTLIKNKTGFPLLQYIHKVKIEKAKKMLSLTNDTLKEIAYKLGIQDVKYFMKLFKAYENLTPTQYRNAFCLTHLNSQ
ncbi:MAG TPA: helix-turn-helix domain-containing protein [Clostridia bacterium]